MTSRKNERPTIGLMTWGLEDTIGHDMWAGAVDAARERGANTVCFVGGVMSSSTGFRTQANVLYDLVSAENIDGLVMWSALVQQLFPEELNAVYERYRPLPMVSIGLPLEDVPSVLVDNYQGMRCQILHLVEDHGYRRIAFIRGPEKDPEAADRYRAYTDVLTEHGLPLDPDRTLPGDNSVVSGVAATRLLLDERKLQPKVDFEAVVASNDNMAFGVMEELEARGIRVPGEVAVVGFDDVAQVQSLVPITTVRYPFYEQGRRAAEMLLALIAGEQVPEQETLLLELTVRQSCGCLAPTVVQAAVGRVREAGQAPEVDVAAEREDLLSKIAQSVGAFSVGVASGWAERLLDGFTADLEGTSPGAFLSALDEVLHQVMAAGGDVTPWQGALSVLRRRALPGLVGEAVFRAEDLWQQARVMIAEAARQAQTYREWQFEQRDSTVREVGQALVAAVDVANLMDVLARELPRLGISGCYLSLYEDPESPAKWSRLVLAYDESGRVPLEEKRQRFPSRQLVPAGTLRHDKPYTMLVQALHFREEQLGFALFEVGAPGDLRETGNYEVLRGQVSSALRGAVLTQQLQDRALQLQTTAEVSSAAGSILDPDMLIPQVVDLVRERFRLYYAGLFLVDQSGEWTGEPRKWAVLQAGTGEAGWQMVAQGHKLEVGGDSMIGLCIANKEARIALAVGEEAARFENPLLPETRSELALPLISRGRAIGALTIQSAEEAAFDDEDIAALQTMADQLANAITSARLYDQTQATLKEMEAAQRRYIQQAWEDTTPTTEALRSYFHLEAEKGRTAETLLPVMAEAMERRDAVVESGERDDALLAVPLTVHGEVVGVLGGRRADGQGWSEDVVSETEEIVEQLALALESQRLFDEAQRATFLMGERVRELDTLNDIGREMEKTPPEPEFLRWVVERLPGAMRHSDVCLASIEYEGQVYGTAEAANLSRQMVQALRVGGEIVGRIYVAYTEEHDFIDEESALLGDVARRVSGYVEGQRLLRETQSRAGELAMLFDVSQELSGGLLQAEEIVEIVARRLVGLGSLECSLSLLDADGDTLRIVADLSVDDDGAIRREEMDEAFRLSDFPATARVMETGRPLLVQASDPGAAPTELAYMREYEVETLLILPLAIKGQAIGVMELESLEERDYTPEQINLVMTLVNQAAVALENTRLFEQTQTALEQVQSVHQRYLRESWQDYLAARGRAAQVAYLYERAQVVREADLDLPEIEQALARKKMVVSDGDGEGGQRVALPISLRGQPIGVLAIEPPPGGRPWSEQDLALIEAVSEQLALAIDGARLFEATQVSAQRERILREITERVRAAADMESLLKSAAQEIRRALGASRAAVRLGLEEKAISPQAESQSGEG